MKTTFLAAFQKLPPTNLLLATNNLLPSKKLKILCLCMYTITKLLATGHLMLSVAGRTFYFRNIVLSTRPPNTNQCCLPPIPQCLAMQLNTITGSHYLCSKILRLKSNLVGNLAEWAIPRLYKIGVKIL